MTVLRYAAFTDDPHGGNPAGVVLDATGMSGDEMQRVAADVGFSETAFLFPTDTEGTYGVRYFSPLVEVPFCGHATIAAAVAHARAHGPGGLVLNTASGPVPVTTAVADGLVTATLTSVPPRVAGDEPARLDDALAALRWTRDDLDPALPPRVAFAGVDHLVLGVRDRATLAALDYDFDALGRVMADEGWTTVQLVHRESETVFHSRNPFPPGGVVEDPATGAAAAAFGAYLRHLGLVVPPVRVTIRQGEDMGRPSLLLVDVPADGPVSVTGSAVPLEKAGLALLRSVVANLDSGYGVGGLLGIRVEHLAEGEVAFSIQARPDMTNVMGTVHGGILATLLDSALSCAVHTTLDDGESYATLDIQVRYVRPVPPDGTRLTATGTVVHRGRRAATAEGRVHDAAGRLVAHATVSCLVSRG